MPRTIGLSAKPIPGSRAFIGHATRSGSFLCTCRDPAGHLPPQGAVG